MDCFSSLEIQKLLQAPAKNKRVSTWIKLIYSFGLSLPEIANLKVTDINLTKQTIKIGGDFHRIRVLHIPKALLPEIQKSIYGKKSEDYLFEGRKGKIHPRTIQKALEKFCCSLGICFSMRKLRNTLIYDLYKHGWDDKSIAFQLGLSSSRLIKQSLMFLASNSTKPHPLDKILKKRV